MSFQVFIKAFYEKDCLLAEINPLVLTGSGDFIALDAKINFDDNGLFGTKRLLPLGILMKKPLWRLKHPNII